MEARKSCKKVEAGQRNESWKDASVLRVMEARTARKSCKKGKSGQRNESWKCAKAFRVMEACTARGWENRMKGHREQHGHAVHAKKSLGQNYLTDEALLEALCADAGVEKDDCVLEIGPGMGALTRPLAQAARQVVAVEIDGTLIS